MPPSTPSLRQRVKARMSHRGPSCGVCTFLASLADPIRKEWVDLIAEPKEQFPHTAVAAEMTEQLLAVDDLALPIHADTIARHRAQDHARRQR